MKVTRETAAAHRGAMVAAASRLFRRRGVAGVGVAEVTRAAGLTHGGFYGHFASKEALAAEACRAAFAEAVARVAGADVAAFARAYLSRAHRDDAEGGCPLVAFTADVARAEAGGIGEAWAEGATAWIDALAAGLAGGDADARRRRASALAALMVGGVSLARALATVSPELSDRLLLDLRAEAAALTAAIPGRETAVSSSADAG